VVFVFFKGSESWAPEAAAAAFAQIRQVIVEATDRCGAVWARSDPGSAYQKLLFLFGAPAAGENDPLRAVGFGLELQDRLAALAHNGLQLDFSIGLATGRVFGGLVGGVTRREYTVMGDAINLAARLAARSFGGLLTIDQTTAHAAGDRYQIKKLKPAQLKGKTGLIPLFRPTGTRERAVPSVQQAGAEYYPQQLEAVSCLVHDVKDTAGCGVCILGEAGCGKSTLVHNIVQHNGSAKQRTIHTTIWPEEQAIAFSGVVRLLRDAFRGTSGDVRTDRDILQARWPTEIDPRWQALFAELLGFSSRPTALVRGLSRQAKMEKLGELLPELVTALAGGSCRTIVLENYQWLDPTSKTTLQFWWKNIARYPFIVLITGRETAEFADHPQLHITTLGAVDKAGMQRLVEHRFPGADPPKNLLTELAGRSRSVPAIAEAYLDYWIEDGRQIGRASCRERV
jgi:class 3 adenylate cyclase